MKKCSSNSFHKLQLPSRWGLQNKQQWMPLALAKYFTTLFKRFNQLLLQHMLIISQLTALTVSTVFLPAGAASPWVSPGTCRSKHVNASLTVQRRDPSFWTGRQEISVACTKHLDLNVIYMLDSQRQTTSVKHWVRMFAELITGHDASMHGFVCYSVRKMLM